MQVRLMAADTNACVVVDLPQPLPEIIISEQRAFVLVLAATEVQYREATVLYQPPLLRNKDGSRKERV